MLPTACLSAAALQRDVPGLTRAVIPVLAAKGIKAVSVGVNPGSAPPAVPQYTPFIWRDEASGTQLLAFWRPGRRRGGGHCTPTAQAALVLPVPFATAVVVVTSKDNVHIHAC